MHDCDEKLAPAQPANVRKGKIVPVMTGCHSFREKNRHPREKPEGWATKK
jgi:hypothetical protein